MIAQEKPVKDLWITRQVPLKYLLGELPLFVVEFPALVLEAHFTALTTDLNQTKPPFDRFSKEVEAFLIRSHPVDRELPRLEYLPQAIRYVPAQYHRYYIDLRGTFADYLNKFSSKSRSTLTRKVRKFTDYCGGELTWREFRLRQEMGEFYQQAREVSRKTYQERLLNAGLPEDDEFREEIFDLADRGLVRGYLLYHHQTPIAYLYCPMQDGVLFYRYLGYDPEYGNWSPGTVLQFVALEKLFGEGKFRMFDFTEGQGPHKEFFATGCERCADVYYLRRTVRNLLLIRSHSMLKNVSGSIVRYLDRLGLKARIKKLIRAQG